MSNLLDMTTHEIRQKYIDFFKNKGHEILPSASLLPENDPTTLFTGSGMQPMIPYLLGEKHPKGARLTDSQKCFRTQDVEEVGDNRHTTFFEMLGNWSLGDYFKREQIPWLFEFLTKEIGLDPNRLYVTCFRGNEELGIPRDMEAAELWKQEFGNVGIDAAVVDFPERDGLSDGRIFYYDEKKNWWSRSGTPDKMPAGEPGGPDSEVFWDFSASYDFHASSPYKDQPCHVNCDCGRFLEIGNSVFMEYRKRVRIETLPSPLPMREGIDSTLSLFEQLPQKNIDFGGGLERIAAAKKDNPDIFMIDVFAAMRATLERVSGKQYGRDIDDTKAFRVILDHLRAAAFLIADGAHPSNKDQGYFTRRLMRRAIRYANQLGIKDHFCAELSRSVIETYCDAYPDLTRHCAIIEMEMEKEEKKFRETLKNGMAVFEEMTKTKLQIPDNIQTSNYQNLTITGAEAFQLYQSYGFPLEMTEELARERSLTVDVNGFKAEQAKHQEVSRQGAEKKFHGGLIDHSELTVMGHTATHLLHAALRKVLGEHVQQKGSNITPERLRFDFSHPIKMTEEEVKTVEDLINGAIARDYPVTWREMPVEDAYKKKTIGFFPERYDDIVKVYTVGDPDQPMTADPAQPTFSQEICGGPHVLHTGALGHVRILKEEACSAGIRRIKAVVLPR